MLYISFLLQFVISDNCINLFYRVVKLMFIFCYCCFSLLYEVVVSVSYVIMVFQFVLSGGCFTFL